MVKVKGLVVSQPAWFKSFVRTALILIPLVALVMPVGCGLGNSAEKELDRVPNVPPSARRTDGAAVVDKFGR